VGEVKEHIWNAVSSAVESGRKLKIVYQKPQDPAGELRLINPYHIVNDAGQSYVIAFCEKRQNIRVFALSRILEARLTSDQFSLPQDFNIRDFLKQRFGAEPKEKPFQVQLEFDRESAPYVKERLWFQEQVVEQNPDGSLILTFQTRSLLETVRWVLSWGSAVKVLEPKELKTRILEESRRLMQKHEPL